FREGFGDDFVPLSQEGLFEEIRLFLEHLELDRTIFRSDHASNYLVLKGTLGRDKQKMLDQVNLAITSPGAVPLRAEWMRGL
ncbi:MAG: radical SAM protein, partial [Gammaproteobacteria bacterium]